MARKANEEMAAIRSQMAEQERRNQENLERHQEDLRRAEQLHAEEKDAYMQRAGRTGGKEQGRARELVNNSNNKSVRLNNAWLRNIRENVTTYKRPRLRSGKG